MGKMTGFGVLLRVWLAVLLKEGCLVPQRRAAANASADLVELGDTRLRWTVRVRQGCDDSVRGGRPGARRCEGHEHLRAGLRQEPKSQSRREGELGPFQPRARREGS